MSLTLEEETDIQSLVLASRATRDAERYLIESIRSWSTPLARGPLADALEWFQRTQVEHWRALAFLLHTGTENTEALPEKTDQEWYDAGWFHLDRYRTKLDETGVLLTAAQAHHVDQVEYQDNLNRARDIWLAQAKLLTDSLTRSLPYADPWTDVPPGKTIPTVVGPHGHYRLMQWYVNRGKNYAMDVYGMLLLAYRAGADGALIREAWLQSSNMLDDLDRATALLADVTFTTEEAAEDRFCRVLRAGKVLTVLAAERYQAWGGAIAMLLPEPMRSVVAKLTDSWKHALDLSTWQSLVFPESTRCASPFLRD